MSKNTNLHFLENVKIIHLRTLKLYKIDVLKPWDYAKTFFHRPLLHISCSKADTGTENNTFWIFLARKSST